MDTSAGGSGVKRKNDDKYNLGALLGKRLTTQQHLWGYTFCLPEASSVLLVEQRVFTARTNYSRERAFVR